MMRSSHSWGSRWFRRARALLLVAALALVAAFVVGAPGRVSAHAYYVSSNPAANATLAAAPASVTIHFAENVNPTGSDIVVYDAHGAVVSGAAQVDRADLKTMTVSMHGDGSAAYLVTWHTVSADDGDPAIGAFTFNVSPGGASAVASPTETPTPPGALGAARSSDEPGAAGWVVALVGVLGLIVGAGGALWARRGR